jgi:hypothetical protein
MAKTVALAVILLAPWAVELTLMLTKTEILFSEATSSTNLAITDDPEDSENSDNSESGMDFDAKD